MMMRLDPEMIERVREDGFLAFDTELPARDIAALRDTLRRLHQNRVGFEEGSIHSSRSLKR